MGIFLDRAKHDRSAGLSNGKPAFSPEDFSLPPRILILEDSQADAELLACTLQAAGWNIDWRRVDTEKDFVAALEWPPEVILADYTVPSFGALGALALLQKRGFTVPFIVVTGTLGDEASAQCIKLGADDYLLKDRLARLPEAVTQALEKNKLREEQRYANSALLQSETRLLGFLNSSQSLMFMKDINGRYLIVNREFCRRFGIAEDQIVGKTDYEVFPVEQAAEFCANDQRVVAARAPLEFEERASYIDGEHFGVVYKFPLIGTEGEIVGIGGIVTDVTERKRAQQRLGVQHAVARVLAESGTYEETAVKLLQVTCEYMGFTIGALWESDIKAGVMRCSDVWHAPSSALELFAAKTREMVLRPQAGIAGRVWKSGRPIWTPNATINPKSPRAPYAAQADLRENLAFPIAVRGQITGVMDFYGPGERDPEPELLDVFAAIGTQVGQFVSRRDKQKSLIRLNRLYAVLSSINSAIIRIRDRQALLNEACKIAVEHGGFGIAWIGMLDQSTLDVVPAAWAGIDSESIARSRNTAREDLPIGQGLVGRAIRERRAVFLNDLTVDLNFAGERRKEAIRRGYHSMIVLPLLIDNTAIGNLSLFAKDPDFFNEEEIALLTNLVEDITFALEHLDKQQKIEKLSRIRAVASEINAAIVRIREPRSLLEETCHIASAQGKFEMVWIGTINPKKEELESVAWAGFSPDLIHDVTWTSVGANKGAMGEAITTRKPVVRHNINVDPPAGILRQAAIDRGYFSSVSIPIEVDDNVAALITLFAQGEGFFTGDELALLNELAANVSMALQAISRQEKLSYIAYYDTLTGLPNRTLFIDRLEQLIHAANRGKGYVATIFMNIERFRHVNDTLGRSAGDELLVETARRLQSAVRAQDTIARLESDCFAVAAAGIASFSDAAHFFKNRIIAAFNEPIIVAGHEMHVALKSGIAVFPNDGNTAETLCANAGVALKNTRATGERYLFYAPEMNHRVAQSFKLEHKMRRALDKEQFVLHYQPKVDLASGKISGLEALIRWDDPESGLVPPAQFIPLLEETGMILDAGRWAIRTALEDYRKWREQGLQPPRIAVNVSPIQLRQKDFVEVLRDLVKDSAVGFHGLDLEITENVIMENIEDSIGKLRAIKDLDINIAIDDFGTGYSSLGYLAKLPLNALKIDRSFIIGVADVPDSMTIVSTIISLAHSLGLKVIAEGAEKEDQLQLLKLLKCDEAQGYFFSRPIAGDQVPSLLNRYNGSLN